MTGQSIELSDDHGLEAISRDYLARGYEVVPRPGRDELPEPLRTFRPDLLVRKGDEVIVVEVKRPSSSGGRPAVRELAAAVREVPGWRFELVVGQVDPERLDPEDARPLTLDEAAQVVEQAQALSTKGHHEAALLLGWSAVEAVLRHLAAAEGIPLKRSSVAYLLESLATQGVLAKEDYDDLWDIMILRNAVAHGRRTEALDTTMIDRLLEIAKRASSRLRGKRVSAAHPTAKRAGQIHR